MNRIEEFWRLQSMIDRLDLPLHMMLRFFRSMDQDEWLEFKEHIFIDEVRAYYRHLKMLIDGILLRIEELEMSGEEVIDVEEV